MTAIHHKTQVNIITGFLGAGKTTVIQYLLNHRPKKEKWAVLVNEFGEVGIDGALLKTEGVQIKEIPGGCMCCVNGLPMQISLNMLLARKPDRLLIEPSGLGHPLEILQTLASPHYRDLVDLHATLTLIDPRKLSDDRYLTHDIFQQQTEVSDVLVASKADLCTASDLQRFSQWAESLTKTHPRIWVHARAGQVSPALLEGCNHQITNLQPTVDKINPAIPALTLPANPVNKLTRKENSNGQFFSYGWQIPESWIFDDIALISWLHSLDTTRIKAVIQTDKGWKTMNGENTFINTNLIDEADASQLELIFTCAMDGEALEADLRLCRVRQ